MCSGKCSFYGNKCTKCSFCSMVEIKWSTCSRKCTRFSTSHTMCSFCSTCSNKCTKCSFCSSKSTKCTKGSTKCTKRSTCSNKSSFCSMCSRKCSFDSSKCTRYSFCSTCSTFCSTECTKCSFWSTTYLHQIVFKFCTPESKKALVNLYTFETGLVPPKLGAPSPTPTHWGIPKMVPEHFYECSRHDPIPWRSSGAHPKLVDTCIHALSAPGHNSTKQTVFPYTWRRLKRQKTYEFCLWVWRS